MKNISYKQLVFNKLIRKRDEGNGCICCGRDDDTLSAGHYLSIGSRPDLRFNLINVNMQCYVCNVELHGNQSVYREKLIEKYGLEEIEKLERHERRSISLEQKYNEAIRELKNN